MPKFANIVPVSTKTVRAGSVSPAMPPAQEAAQAGLHCMRASSEIALSKLAGVPPVVAAAPGRSYADLVAACVEPGVVLPPDNPPALDFPSLVREALASTPPINKGVESAEPNFAAELITQNPKEAFIDYLRFSVTKASSMWTGVDDCRLWLNNDLEGWRAGNGGNFYRESWHCGGWTIYYNGRQEGMGFCVQFSGTGCRELEAHPKFTTWSLLLSALLGHGGLAPVNFTRLDVALDDKEGALDLVEIERKTRAGEYTCRGGSDIDASPSLRGSHKRGGVTEWGVTVYFGRRSSSQLCRFYNKAVEQANKEGREVGDPWVRVEYEAKDERAAALAAQIVKDGLGCVGGIILNYVNVKEAEGAANSQKCRQETCSWWSSFLASWEKVRLAVAPSQRTILKLRQWLETQVAPSLATAYESFSGKLRKKFLADLVQTGQRNMKKRHNDMLKRENALLAALILADGSTGF